MFKKKLMILLAVCMIPLLFSFCSSHNGSGGNNSEQLSSAGDSATKEDSNNKTYIVGETGPAGGIVFYVNANEQADGWKYLEAAPSDQSNGQVWSNITNLAVGAGSGSGIGTGITNTAIILAQAGHTASAAKLCSELVINGYNGWFLPSREELKQMYMELKAKGLGALLGNQYWSSTSSFSDIAWAIQFNKCESCSLDNNGVGMYWPKDTPSAVRCVRSF